MSLRVRLGLAAGVAVAIAVLAVALSAYEGTRSELRDQLDDSLSTLSQSVVGRAGDQPGAPAIGGRRRRTRAAEGKPAPRPAATRSSGSSTGATVTPNSVWISSLRDALARPGATSSSCAPTAGSAWLRARAR